MKLLQEKTTKLAGVTLHTIPATKYKTNTIFLRLKAPLTKEDVSYRALLPFVLQSGTEDKTNTKEIRAHLEDLYGAGLSVDVSKKGDYHVIHFAVDVVNEKYLSDQTPLFEQSLVLLSDILLRPYKENKVFAEKYVENEKRSLIQKLEAIFDDKMRYANERLMQEMFKEEVYALNAYGIKKEIEQITSETLYAYYEKTLLDDEIDLFVVGDIDEEVCKQLVNKYFPLKDRIAQSPQPTVRKEITQQEVIEEQEVGQEKLHMGYRTGITYTDSDYFAMQMFNGIFGGFAHSKLFMNVREKNSLAYYAASRMDSHTGTMLVLSGIESSNYEKATTIIGEQLKEMRVGNFTNEEIAQTKAVLTNQILETIDTPRGLIEILYHNVIAKCERTIQDWLTGIEQVTKEEIIAVANKIQLDTIYFLKEEGK